MDIEVPQRTPCPFCENIAGRYPCAFVFQNNLVASFINPRQYGKGAVLIIPKRHAATMFDLTNEEAQAINTHAYQIARALHKAFHAAGYNVFHNNGSAAGQSVPHFHTHVVPRYGDDEPSRIFSQTELKPTPFEKRLALAQAIQAHL